MRINPDRNSQIKKCPCSESRGGRGEDHYNESMLGISHRHRTLTCASHSKLHSRPACTTRRVKTSFETNSENDMNFCSGEAEAPGSFPLPKGTLESQRTCSTALFLISPASFLLNAPLGGAENGVWPSPGRTTHWL